MNVNNIGDAASSPCTNKLFIDGVFIKDWQSNAIDSIAANGNSRVDHQELTFTPSQPFPLGQHQVKTVVDALNQNAELIETNNETTVSLSVLQIP